MARAGESVILAEREVTIHDLALVSWDGDDPERPVAVIEMSCSAGTYVRALARDLGEAVGSAAYLGALTRTASGPFTLGDAVDLETIRAAAADGPSGLTPYLRPIDAGLEGFPTVPLSPDEVTAVARGQFVRPSAGVPTDAETFRLLGPDGSLVAIASGSAGRLAPDKVFVTPAPAIPVG
jgi:tRNA pseudouridine55 synthase